MDAVANLISGNLSAVERVWSALAPAILVTAYFVLGLVAYVVRWLVVGPYSDPGLERRDAGSLAGMSVRGYFGWVMFPAWVVISRANLPPHALSTLSVLLAAAAGVALGNGRFALGGWLYVFAGIVDLIDDRLARGRAAPAPGAAALETVLDRYSDAMVLCGLAWYYRDTWVLAPVLAALVGSSVVPYIRARGEASGVDMRVGLMRRAERILYLGIGCALSPIVEVILVPGDPRPLHRVAVVGVVLTAAASHLTALQRLMHMMSGLGARQPLRWVTANQGPFLRNTASAAGATALDFLLVLAIVTYADATAPLATAIGCVAGGLANYGLNRWWTFGSTAAKLPEMWRYTFVSASSAALNSGGVAVLLLVPALDYRVAWILVRVAVYVAWNFPLQRSYVFGPQSGAARKSAN
jgi:phosphatidylglycerophosphate synthase/putative flippase GtrA